MAKQITQAELLEVQQANDRINEIVRSRVGREMFVIGDSCSIIRMACIMADERLTEKGE